MNHPCITHAFLRHLSCITHAFFIHPSCITHASPMHLPCIPHAFLLHPSCIAHASLMHFSCIFHASLMHPPIITFFLFSSLSHRFPSTSYSPSFLGLQTFQRVRGIQKVLEDPWDRILLGILEVLASPVMVDPCVLKSLCMCVSLYVYVCVFVCVCFCGFLLVYV